MLSSIVRLSKFSKKQNAYIARSYGDAPDVDGYVFLNTDETLVTGDFARVRITGASDYDLIGELL